METAAVPPALDSGFDRGIPLQGSRSLRTLIQSG